MNWHHYVFCVGRKKFSVTKETRGQYTFIYGISEAYKTFLYAVSVKRKALDYLTYPLREFWEISLPHRPSSYRLKLIENAWERVTKRILTSTRKKLWSDSVVECDFEEFETVPVKPVVNKIVSGQDHGTGGVHERYR
ncbi:hypothetical protein AVEN_183034-1 [Araneus ventricosus]|uniref:DDE-1 domain-containing protein n=1 Tax=Araneus ventricosus TaxID=182803 RepID=A0A4Y2EX24_ARAVE|nr:hypothetical protein AVEN_183034-1 [Araneus ventricosus]